MSEATEIALAYIDESVRRIAGHMETLAYQHEQPTLRDRFAMAAPDEDIDVVTSTAADAARYLGITTDEYMADRPGNYMRLRAKLRYQFADAMMKERAK